jgi:SPW repeat
LALAAILFDSPWVLGFAGQPHAAWMARVTGVMIAVLALAAIVQFTVWEEWANLALGLWLIVAPWAAGFTSVAPTRWSYVVLGILVAAVAGSEVWFGQFDKSATTGPTHNILRRAPQP